VILTRADAPSDQADLPRRALNRTTATVSRVSGRVDAYLPWTDDRALRTPARVVRIARSTAVAAMLVGQTSDAGVGLRVAMRGRYGAHRAIDARHAGAARAADRLHRRQAIGVRGALDTNGEHRITHAGSARTVCRRHTGGRARIGRRIAAAAGTAIGRREASDAPASLRVAIRGGAGAIPARHAPNAGVGHRMADGVTGAVRVGQTGDANSIHHVAEGRGRAAGEVICTGRSRYIGARIRATPRPTRTSAASRCIGPAGTGARGPAAAARGSGSAAPASARRPHACGTSRLRPVRIAAGYVG